MGELKPDLGPYSCKLKSDLLAAVRTGLWPGYARLVYTFSGRPPSSEAVHSGTWLRPPSVDADDAVGQVRLGQPELRLMIYPGSLVHAGPPVPVYGDGSCEPSAPVGFRRLPCKDAMGAEMMLCRSLQGS